MNEELRIDLDTHFEKITDFSLPGLDGPGNAIIEGDNLSALYFLNQLPEAEGGIDLMYWDPPYNTGSQGFYYEDDRTASTENGESHWSHFIRTRAKNAHYNLKETGCFAVHIDERELQRLWKIMNEVFKPRNFFGLISWLASKGTGGRISNTTEFILIFAKNASALHKNLPIVSYPTENAHHFKNPDNDPRGPWRGRIKAGRTRAHQYGIEDYNTGLFAKPTFGWRHTPERMVVRFQQEGLNYAYDKANYRLVLLSPPKLNGVLPQYYFKNGELRRKEYRTARDSRPGSLHTLIEGRGMRAEEGTKTFRAIMGIHPLDFNFGTIKPVDVCKKLIRHLCPENGLIVDAFAGTGSAAQAVLELNKEYNHSRRFILIERGGWQKGEKTFSVNEILAERVRRVISGKWATGEKPPVPGSFNYYKLISGLSEIEPPTPPHYFYVMEIVKDINDLMKLIKIGITDEKGSEARRKAHAKKNNLHVDQVHHLKEWTFKSKKDAENFETALQRKIWHRRALKQGSDETFRLNDEEIAELLLPKAAEDLRAYVETLS
jgi:adenine-specific DNA-methyltransferase